MQGRLLLLGCLDRPIYPPLAVGESFAFAVHRSVVVRVLVGAGTQTHSHSSWTDLRRQGQEVYKRVLAGERNFSAIARDLGITRTLVGRILRNPIYAGVRRIDRHCGAGGSRPRTSDAVIENRVLDPPLIPMDTWQQAHEILSKRPAPSVAKRTPVHLPRLYGLQTVRDANACPLRAQGG